MPTGDTFERPKPRPRPRPPVRRTKVKVKLKRPTWRPKVAADHPVRKGENRRHFVEVDFMIRFISQLGAKHLSRMGYRPRHHGGLDEARKAWLRDRFNDPTYFWRGDEHENKSKGASGKETDAYDMPTRKQAKEERDRRAEEARKRLEAEQRARERLEREREEKERQKTRERDQQRRDQERDKQRERERERK